MSHSNLCESPSAAQYPGTALPASAEAMRERLRGTNIHSESFLATDYLNHFNEVVMMLEMAADMPDMLDDIIGWAPKSYEAHFRDSGFADRELAIAAYDMAPTPVRTHFDALVAELDAMILGTIEDAVALRDDPDRMAAALAAPFGTIRDLLCALNGVIHGVLGEDAGSDIGKADAGAVDGGASQADIDALFD